MLLGELIKRLCERACVKDVLKVFYERVALQPCQRDRIMLQSDASGAIHFDLEPAGAWIELIPCVLAEAVNQVLLIDNGPNAPSFFSCGVHRKRAGMRPDSLRDSGKVLRSEW